MKDEKGGDVILTLSETKGKNLPHPEILRRPSGERMERLLQNDTSIF